MEGERMQRVNSARGGESGENRRMEDAVSNLRREVRRLGAKWLPGLVTKHIKVALEGDDETARKCREFVINTFMNDAARNPAGAESDSGSGVPLSSLSELSDELKDRVLAELGGPTDDGVQE